MTDAYVVTSGSYSDYHVMRVYLDEAEASNFVEQYNKVASDHAYVETFLIGAPRGFDGIVWQGTYSQVFAVAQVIPGSVHPNVYELQDNFDYRQTWWTGETPPRAKVEWTNLNSYGNTISARVVGSSREHVEKSLQDTVARLKAEKEGVA